MSTPTPPIARREPLEVVQHGRTRIDDYAWLRDKNWQAVMRDPSVLRPDVRAHLDAENAYTAAMLASTEALQAQLFAEMRGRMKEDDASVPSPDGPWSYGSRFEAGAQHPKIVRTPRGGGAEEVLLDIDAMAAGHGYFQVGAVHHSPDHALIAWAEDDQGSEYYRIRTKDLASGRMLDGAAESATGDFVFSPDGLWLFWTWRDENGRPARVYRRPARGGEDALVHEEADAGMFLGVGVTASRSHVVIEIGNQETSEVRLIPATDPTAQPVTAEPRVEGVRYELDHWGDRFVIRTNADEAVDFKLMTSSAAVPAKATWHEWVPHRPGVYLLGLQPFAGHLVRLERVEANNRLVVTRKADLSETEIAFDEAAYVLSLDGGYEYDTPTVRFTYTSPTTPRQTFDHDMATGERVLRKTQEVPSGHDPAVYVTARLTATAPDGETVPITVLARRDTPIDGTAPLMVYGYGAYGHSSDPAFSIRNLSLVDRGWVWAIAHVRGGSEKGWGWFLDGRKARKVNSFTDFVACADHLLARGYGAPDKVVAYGGSAGGLLVGAAANLRPELWAGVIGAVPFVDVLTTMSDPTLPLTPPEWPEWGNPIDDPEAYRTIAAYSPYDQVVAAPYPAILATGGLSDPRVTYWEPAKWVARLREKTTSGDPVLLRMVMEGGHGGASGRFEFLREIALDYAFAIWAVERGWARP